MEENWTWHEQCHSTEAGVKVEGLINTHRENKDMAAADGPNILHLKLNS